MGFPPFSLDAVKHDSHAGKCLFINDPGASRMRPIEDDGDRPGFDPRTGKRSFDLARFGHRIGDAGG